MTNTCNLHSFAFLALHFFRLSAERFHAMDERTRARFDEHASVQPASAANEQLSFREAGELDTSNHELALELDDSALDLRASSRSRMNRSFLADSASFLNPTKASHGDDGKASMSSSIINLVNSVLGTGLLSLPRAFAHAGFAWGFFFSTLAFGLNIMTSVFVSDACRRADGPASFTKIADSALVGYSLLVNFGLICNCLAATCSYVVVATDSFHVVFGRSGPSYYWTILTLCIVTPLSFLKSMDSLRFTSLAAVIIVLFLTALIVAYSVGVDDGSLLDPCPVEGATADCPAVHGTPPRVEAAGSPWGVVSAFSSLSMAYGAQMSIPPIFNEMVDPTPRRMALVYVAGYGTAWVLYGVCAMCGYKTFGRAVSSNILDSYPSNDLVATGRVGLAFVTIFSFPILAMAFRNAGVGLVGALRVCCRRGGGGGGGAKAGDPLARCTSSKEEREEGSPPTFLQQRLGCLVLEPLPACVTLILIVVAGTVGFTITDIGIIADLGGALGAMLTSFIAPASIYFLTFRERRCTPLRALAAVITAFGVVMLVLGVYTALCGCTDGR